MYIVNNKSIDLIKNIMISTAHHQYNIIVFSETWLGLSVLNGEFTPTNHKIFSLERNRKKCVKEGGDGLLIFRKKTHKLCECC